MRFILLLTLISDKAKEEYEWTQNTILESHDIAAGNSSQSIHQGEVKNTGHS